MMKKHLASIVLFALIAPVLAQDPVEPTQPPVVVDPVAEASVVLEAPSKARIGELIRFDASGSVANSFEWRLVPQTPDFEVYDGGAKACFSARAPGEYQFVLAVAYENTVDVRIFSITIVGPPEAPVSDSLAEWIPVWLWSAFLPEDECEALADSFETLANRADLQEPRDWSRATAEANRAALGDRIDAWKPILNKVGAALQKLAETGALTTPEDHRKVWLDIAAGLRSS